MRIVGIDPGSVVTGIAVIEYDNWKVKALYYDVIKMNSRLPLTSRLKKIYDGCSKVFIKYKPDVAAIETNFYGKNIQSTLKLGQAKGVAVIAAINNNIEVVEYSPREIKKSVTGNGGSNKEQVQIFVKKILSLKLEPILSDASDALATALCYYFSTKEPLKIRSYKKISWKDYIETHPDKIYSYKK